MTIQLDFPPDMEARLQAAAARSGQEPDEYVKSLVKEQLIANELEALKHRHRPQSVDELEPRAPSPPGTSWLAQVWGQWPGDESEEELFKALEEIS